jgi:glycosyltransferase involved in cell wall biosynthesis
MFNPIITIGIPSYNQQDFLPDAIESALAQGLCEVLICDDGSTDNSLAIAKSYEAQGVKVISQVNKGLASARNTLIMNMKGEFLLPLDADDILLDGAVEKIIEVMAQTNADIIAPSFKEFGIRNEEIVLMENPTLEDFKTGNRIGYCSATKRSVLQEVGGYNPKMVHGYEDYDLWFDLLKRGKTLVTISDILWLYRTKEHSMINDAQEHHEELMNQIKTNHPEI